MKRYMLILAMVMLALSCERQLREPHPVEVVYMPSFSLSFAGDAPAEQVRTVAAYKLAGTKYLYASQDGELFSLEDGADVPSHIAYAVWPAEGRDSLARGVFCRDLPSEQTAVAGGHDQSAGWYAGHVKDNHAVMQQTFGFLQFKVVQPDVAEVKIVSRGAPLAGMYTFAMNNPVRSAKSDESTYNITLTGDFAVGSTYKAVCIPGSFKDFDITMKNADGNTLWNGTVSSESTIACSQTADLGDFGNPNAATVVLKVTSEEFVGYDVQSVNAFFGPELTTIFGSTVSGKLEAGQISEFRLLGVNAADYTGKDIWVVVALEKEGVQTSVPVKIDGMNIPVQETVTIKLPDLTSGAQFESDDNYTLYRMGQTITIGDLKVNQTDYPEAVLKAPSEITLSLLQGGGLIFIDDEGETAASIDLSTADSFVKCPSNVDKKLILIGRYKRTGVQTELKFKQWRTCADLAVMNVRLTCNYSSNQLQMFAKASDDANQTALRLQDCHVDMTMAKYLIEDMAASKCVPYSHISIDNCVVKMSDQVNETSLYRYRNTTTLSEIVAITNSVIYTPSLTNNESHLYRIYSDIAASGMRIDISGNTILNIHGNVGIIRRGSQLDGLSVSGNLVATDNRDNNPVITTANNRNVFFVKNTGTPSGGNNFLTTINYTGDGNTINLSKMQSLTQISTDIVEQTLNPFTSLNYTTGYFPVDESVVTNGAGASYDTKYFIIK